MVKEEQVRKRAPIYGETVPAPIFSEAVPGEEEQVKKYVKRYERAHPFSAKGDQTFSAKGDQPLRACAPIFSETVPLRKERFSGER